MRKIVSIVLICCILLGCLSYSNEVLVRSNVIKVIKTEKSNRRVSILLENTLDKKVTVYISTKSSNVTILVNGTELKLRNLKGTFEIGPRSYVKLDIIFDKSSNERVTIYTKENRRCDEYSTVIIPYYIYYSDEEPSIGDYSDVCPSSE